MRTARCGVRVLTAPQMEDPPLVWQPGWKPDKRRRSQWWFNSTIFRYSEEMLREMSPFELGWVVGLFEGEGSISTPIRRRIQIQLSSTDEDTLTRLRDFTGVGNIYKLGRRPQAHYKQVWMWTAQKHGDAIPLLELILPHLGERRRERVQTALAHFRATPVRENGSHTNAVTKLTRSQVEEARALYATGNYTFRDLGEKYGVHRDSLRYAINRGGWA